MHRTYKLILVPAILTLAGLLLLPGCNANQNAVTDGPGNVDMLTWVTMTDEGPEIAGIALKGVFDRKGLDPAMFEAYDRTPDPDGIKH